MPAVSHKQLASALLPAVLGAGAIEMRHYRAGVTVETKADDSPVTEADRQGEILITRLLKERFPDIPVIGEEHASEYGTPDEIGPRFFLVDPVDGTKAFVRGDPSWTVNIGLIQDRHPVAGAVSSPASGETWYTSASGALKRTTGQPAQACRVRPWPQGQAIALISHTMKEDAARKLAETYRFDTTLAMDSSVKLCRIAEGTADIYPRHGPTSEWDIAAAQAVLEAAGGTVLTPEGQPFLYGKADEQFRNGWFVARGG